MRGMAILCGLALAIGGCSDNGQPGPDAGVDHQILADGPVGDLQPPARCSPACQAGEVCTGGACVVPGPTKSCGAGPWEDNLPSTGVIYVDGSYVGSGDGSKAMPFTSIGAAVATLTGTSGAVIAVTDGVYAEDVTIEQPVALRCRCPQKVRIAGSVLVKTTTASLAVLIDGCTIAKSEPDALATWGECVSSSHTACQGGSGCTAPETCDPVSSQCVHPEEGKDMGIRALGGDPVGAVNLTVRDTEIAGWCAGVYFNTHHASTSSLCVSRARLRGNQKGLELVNAPPIALSPGGECSGLTEAAAATLSRIDDNEYAGVFSRSLARGVALKGNLVARSGLLKTGSGDKQTGGDGGYGIYLGTTSSAQVRENRVDDNLNVGLGLINAEVISDAEFDIRDNDLARNVGAGISLQQLQTQKLVTLTGNRVTDTLGSAGGQDGDGIQVLVAGGTSYKVTVQGNVVQGSARHGVILDRVEGSVGGNVVGSSGGYGVLLQQAPMVTVGQNSFSGNAKGDVQNNGATAPQEKCESLPLPLP